MNLDFGKGKARSAMNRKLPHDSWKLSEDTLPTYEEDHLTQPHKVWLSLKNLVFINLID